MSETTLSGLAALRLRLSRDKADTLLLLAAAALVLGPHAGHLPLWVSAICASTLAWRGAITMRGTRLPSAPLLAVLAGAAMSVILISYKTLLGREAGVAMAVILLAFKMLEMRARRDLFVVIYLCFFLILTNFFYSQSIATALLMVASIVVLLTAQLTFQYTGAVPSLGRRLRLGASILGIAAPVALALFFLFPRIQGPLWGMPGDAHGGHTGMSNSMAPGNVASLAQSTEIAFRVKFHDRLPAKAQLYWRGIVLGDFDGRTWTPAHPNSPHSVSVNGAPVRYQVTLEPNDQRWLFALDLPGSVPELTNATARISGEFELSASARIEERVRYEVSSQLDYVLDAGALPARARWLLLPQGFNPKAIQAGLALQREPDPFKRVELVLARFRSEPFRYTLEPPRLGVDSVDEFLYQTQAGFCEHYASAFVFLMRAAGVPARVVTGYQGGELNPVDGFVTVRQSDAHAWAEVWLAQRGWVRVDPTGAVAPERIEHNLARALHDQTPFGLSQLGNLINIDLDSQSLLAQLRFRLNALNNGWNQWVLNYDPERRRSLADTLADTLLQARSLGALAAVAALLLLVRARRVRAQTDPVDALYSALCLQMGKFGVVRARDEGPAAYAQRVAGMALAPEKKAAALEFLRLYSRHKYAPQAPERGLVTTLKTLLARSR